MWTMSAPPLPAGGVARRRGGGLQLTRSYGRGSAAVMSLSSERLLQSKLWPLVMSVLFRSLECPSNAPACHTIPASERLGSSGGGVVGFLSPRDGADSNLGGPSLTDAEEAMWSFLQEGNRREGEWRAEFLGRGGGNVRGGKCPGPAPPGRSSPRRKSAEPPP